MNDSSFSEKPLLMSDDWEIPEYEPRIFQSKTSTYCIVTAAWNEGDKCVNQYLRMAPYSSEIDFIVVNRGEELISLDESFLTRKLCIRNLLQVNEPGQSSAYRTGLAFAMARGYEGVIMKDSNGKDDVSAIPSFVHNLENGYDLVQGSRFMRGGFHENTPLYRIIAIRIVAATILWLGCKYWYSDQNNGFKGFSRKFLLDHRILPFRKAFRSHNLQVYLNYAAAKHGFTIIQVPTSRVYPSEGQLASKIQSVGQHIRHLGDYIEISMGKHNPKE